MSSCGEVWPQFSIQGFKLTYLVEVSQKLSALSNDSWISFFLFANVLYLFRRRKPIGMFVSFLATIFFFYIIFRRMSVVYLNS